MTKQNTIVTILALLFVVFLTWKASDWYYTRKLDEVNSQVRNEKIKNSELTKVKEGLYTKLVADTLKIKELEELNDSLKLELKDPEIITKVKWKVKYLDKPVDGIVLEDSLLTLKDYYPDSLSPFVTYNLKLNLKSLEGNGKWDFSTQELSLGIGQNEDGTYSINTKVPEFLEITELSVNSLPMEKEEKDDFGILMGLKGGRNFLNKNNLFGISGGIRTKKLYLDSDVLIGDESLIGLLGLKIEF